MNVQAALAHTCDSTDYQSADVGELDAALADPSVEIPAGTTVWVMEDKPDVHYLVLRFPSEA